MHPLTLAIAGAFALALPAAAGVQSQSLKYDWDINGDLQIGTLDGFDSMGGTRVLTGVSFGIDATATWSVTALNYSPTAFSAGEWWADGLANVNVLFGEFGPGGVERITGAVGFIDLTGDLGAGSGDPIFGEPGDPSVSDTFTAFIGNYFELDASEFAAFQNGPVATYLPVFTDAYADGPNGTPGNILIQTDSLSSFGTITLNYTYDVVPAPGAAGVLGMAGLIGLRRRR